MSEDVSKYQLIKPMGFSLTFNSQLTKKQLHLKDDGGVLTVGGDMPMDEAAKQFIDLVINRYGSELAAVTRERDALKAALERLATGEAQKINGAYVYTNEYIEHVLAKLESGELRL